jgi:uncharacterized DUF497 family protein
VRSSRQIQKSGTWNGRTGANETEPLTSAEAKPARLISTFAHDKYGLKQIQFEWDPAKARVNLRRHGVPFREAASVFRDPLGITIFDPDHSEEEDRFITFGFSGGGRLLMVAHTDRVERVRIISTRELTHEEREA